MPGKRPLHHLVDHARISAIRGGGRCAISRGSCTFTTAKVVLHLGIQLLCSLRLGSTRTPRLLLFGLLISRASVGVGRLVLRLRRTSLFSILLDRILGLVTASGVSGSQTRTS